MTAFTNNPDDDIEMEPPKLRFGISPDEKRKLEAEEKRKKKAAKRA
jgi:hypothetical protein